MNILHIDTESNEITKQPESIQWNFSGAHDIIEEFNDASYAKMKCMWDTADAVIMWNAPYDLGVLSICYPQNKFSWVNNKSNVTNITDIYTTDGDWYFIIFGNYYEVRRITFHKNLIKNMGRLKLDEHNEPQQCILRCHEGDDYYEQTGFLKQRGVHSTPVIDLLKLWSIIMDDPDDAEAHNRCLSLKSKNGKMGVIEHWLHKKAIDYKRGQKQSAEYKLQDVDVLPDLWTIFTENIPKDLNYFELQDWADIKTQASIVKKRYADVYGNNLRNWHETYKALMKEDNHLHNILEHAYFGGFTISWWRGIIKPVSGVDIKSCYANCQALNDIERYFLFEVKKIDEYEDSMDTLYLVETNLVLDRIDGGLKIFKVERPVKIPLWHDDIEALKLIEPTFSYNLIDGYKFVPKAESHNLVNHWLVERNNYKKGTTMNRFCKTCANVSYGIHAQRWPAPTPHTNMVMAGMITAKCHLVLGQIMDEMRKMGKNPVYSDTDSCFIHGEITKDDFARINKRTHPYSVSFEGTFKNGNIRSLKRYGFWNGTDLDGKKIADKVTSHGRGRYDVTNDEFFDFIKTGKCKKDRVVGTKMLAANTGRTMGYLVQAHPEITHSHPFMFVDATPTLNKKGKPLMLSEFLGHWYNHIDVKTTHEQPKEYEGMQFFPRYLHTFYNRFDAATYFSQFKITQAEVDESNDECRQWDSEIRGDQHYTKNYKPVLTRLSHCIVIDTHYHKVKQS